MIVQRQEKISAGMRRVGDSWLLFWDGRATVFDTQRGFWYLNVLVRHPDQQIPAAVLMAGAKGAPMVPDSRETILDAEGIRRLRTEDDPEVQRYLARYASGGRARDGQKKVRLAVRFTLKYAIKAIAATQLEAMAEHLDRTILPGVQLTYHPDLDTQQVAWKF